MSFSFDPKRATDADRGGIITESGNYVGIIKDALEKTMPTGSKFFNLKFESNEGLKSDYISICTGKKDGTPAFGCGHIHALIGILGISNMDGVEVDAGTRYVELLDKPIGVCLQKEHIAKKDGTPTFRMNLLHFYDAETKKTYSETVNKVEAKTWGRPVKDKSAAAATTADAITGDGLPF